MEPTMCKKPDVHTKISKLTKDNDKLKSIIWTIETTMVMKLADQTRMIDKLTVENEELK